VDGGTDGGVDAGPTDGGPPVHPVVFNWSLKGAADEYSIGAGATASSILWIRYVYGASGKITTVDRVTGAFVSTQLTDLAPYNVVSMSNTVALLGRGIQSNDDWRVQWLTAAGGQGVRSDSMAVVVAGGGIINGAIYEEPDAGLWAHIVSPKTSSGTHVSALVGPDGGVRRTESTCGNVVWWDGATAEGSNRRYFIGAINAQTCDFGGGQYFGPGGANQFKWVLVRYSGTNGPGVPIVRELNAATGALKGPAALGANANSVWIAYYAPTGHLRLEHFSADTLSSQGAVQATGQPYVTGQTELGLAIADVVPHPTRNTVYVLVTVKESKSRWSNEALPALNQMTLAVYTFDKTTRQLLSVKWIPSSNAAKYASSMVLVDDQLVVSGQCAGTPAGGTSDPLCSPTESASDFSFIFSTPAP
jgi:hypothetical protein